MHLYRVFKNSLLNTFRVFFLLHSQHTISTLTIESLVGKFFSDVSLITFYNNTGAPSNVDIYGLQFLSSEYPKEDFIPQTLDIEWDVGSTQYGSFYMGPGESARVYQLVCDGYTWLDECTITFLDLWGAGLSGEGIYGDWNDQTFDDEPSAENSWTRADGIWSLLQFKLKNMVIKNATMRII